jgi:hypothetical protein
MAPTSLAPSLFKVGFRKKQSVKEALHMGKWMRGLNRISSGQGLEDFVQLWEKIQDVHLSVKHDSIAYTLVADWINSKKIFLRGPVSFYFRGLLLEFGNY